LIARDPAAREKVRRYRRTAELARAAFDPVLDEPVPERLLAAARRATPLSNVVAFRPRRHAPLWSLPLAASIALAIGLSAGWWLGAGPTAGVDLVSTTLERSASGETVRAGGLAVTAASVFPGADGRWCRDFTQQQGDARSAGFACRRGEGRWTIEALLPAEEAGSYAPAAEEEPSALDALVEAARTGPALSADQEAALIARGWQ
jgi:anti-sigma factor RsiW